MGVRKKKTSGRHRKAMAKPSSNKKKRKANQLVRPTDSNHKKNDTQSTSPPTKKAATRKADQTTPTPNETLACVSSPWGPIQTPVVSHVVQDVILERFQKELIQRYPSWLNLQEKQLRRRKRSKGKLSDNIATTTTSTSETRIHDVMHQQNANYKSSWTDEESFIQSLLRRKIIVGTNQCTRALEAAIQVKQQHPERRSTQENVIVVDASKQQPLPAAATPSLILLAKDVYPPTILAHIPVMARQVGTPVVLLPRNASCELGKLFQTRRVAIVAFLPSQQPTLAQANTNTIPSCTTNAPANNNNIGPDVVANSVAEMVATEMETQITNPTNGDTVEQIKIALSVNAALNSYISFVRSKITAS